MEPVKKIWMDGSLVGWDEAKVHILTHSLHYGLGVFEGIRCYETERAPAVFRLPEHLDRLFRSAHIVGLKPSCSREEVSEAIRLLIQTNALQACYIRPIIYLGYGDMGINHARCPVRVSVVVWRWGTYLGDEALTRGVRVKISSYTSHHVNTNMTKAKVCGNYALSQLAKMEAVRLGYDEALLLDLSGMVAQGSGENIFIVRDGVLKTPPPPGVLEGITRDSVIRLAERAGLRVLEEPFARDELYIADEAFFTGTAAEVTPIREVDERPIGDGKPGPVTHQLQKTFFEVVKGKNGEFERWLTYL